jgi:hypothetical protein
VVFPNKWEDAMPFDFEGVWREMEECHLLGLTKAVGISNFATRHLDKILTAATVPPAVNQVTRVSNTDLNIVAMVRIDRYCSELLVWSAGGVESGLAAEEAESILRREGHPRRGLLAVGWPEMAWIRGQRHAGI